MSRSFQTKGICAKTINFNVENGKVKDVEFVGGCPGNHAGIESLVEGMEVDDVIKRLRGITCGHRESSCPDQLAVALEEYKAENK
ncbi:TIGR03905 family TSCPD domain-containing protein [Anaerotignum faecicola]|nr:TIGR03905 family TSCPD domain-containing protein [Anaerotignum faecicola]